MNDTVEPKTLAILVRFAENKYYPGSCGRSATLTVSFVAVDYSSKTIRNIGDGYCGEGSLKHFANLELREHIFQDSREMDRYPRIGFFQPYSVELERAESMVKVLKSIERGLKKITEEDGYPESFGGSILRLAKVTKAKWIIVEREDATRSGWSYDDNKSCYRWLNPPEAVGDINWLWQKWLQQFQKAETSA